LDEHDGRFFIVMEYVRGHDLRHLLAASDLLPLEEIVQIIKQVGEALDYAHRHGLIHRDIKPHNILIREDGAVKLTDFGIVRAAKGTRFTTTGNVVGTAAYMSPEQTKGLKLDGRSDLYALGVIAFEMVTGEVPFTGETPVTIGVKHVQEPPPVPSTVAPRATGAIEATLLKALAKDPDDRYQSGEALGKALEAAVIELHQHELAKAYQNAQEHINAGRFSDALAAFQKLQAVAPYYSDVSERIEQTKQLIYESLYTEGANLLTIHRYEQALEILTNLQQKNPEYKDVVKRLEQAREGIELAEKYQEATIHLEKSRALIAPILAKKPDFPDEDGVIRLISDQPLVPKSQILPQRMWTSLLPLIGIAIIITSYMSTTWKWVAELTLREGNLEATYVSVEGPGILFIDDPNILWHTVVWLPLIAAILTIAKIWMDGKQSLAISYAHRTITLLGLISTCFLIPTMENVAGPSMIIIGTLLLSIDAWFPFFIKHLKSKAIR
jgi:tetratricopeptide (TPR) repeat protein